MSIAANLQSFVPSIERNGNFIRDTWDRMAAIPGGKLVFSRLVGVAAPYTGSMGARIVDLGRGFARTELSDRRKVRNHLDCIHAVALANLIELTGNVAVAYTLPDDARFIVAGMSIDYLKKARGTITGHATCPLFRDNNKAEHEIVVTLTDRKGEEVARGRLRTLVGPKKER
jgi:acyl-coenzyme A thioesterase PaaI-like protein